MCNHTEETDKKENKKGIQIVAEFDRINEAQLAKDMIRLYVIGEEVQQ